MKPGMQNAHWKPCSSMTPCCTGCSLPSALASPSIVTIFLAAHGVREHRARIVRHIVDQHGAGAAFGAVAAELGAGEAQLVAQRHRQRFLLHHVDAPLLAVDVQRDQPLARAGSRLAVQDVEARNR